MSYLNWLDTLRVIRHEYLYGLDIVEESLEDAEDAYKASKFIDKIAIILKSGF